MRDYQSLKRELLKDKKIKKAYQELGPEFELVLTLIKKRLTRGITQKELARRIGTKQSAIARLESGNYNPTLGFIRKVAEALNTKIKISIY